MRSCKHPFLLALAALVAGAGCRDAVFAQEDPALASSVGEHANETRALDRILRRAERDADLAAEAQRGAQEARIEAERAAAAAKVVGERIDTWSQQIERRADRLRRAAARELLELRRARESTEPPDEADDPGEMEILPSEEAPSEDPSTLPQEPATRTDGPEPGPDDPEAPATPEEGQIGE
ncbi:MAG: hypothetical protein HYY06_23095 [Deltaproteobacteria bacterium]|nr:hypothetical protein [Deltaproteobacteria bacterium]